MAGQSLLGAGIVSALLLATTLPSGAAPASPDDPWVVFAASDGNHGVARLSELTRDYGLGDSHQAGFQHCYGTAPLENTCTLRAFSSYPAPLGTWFTGWYPPTLAPNGILPENGGYGSVGALVGSTQLEMTGDANTAKVLARCDWATPGVFGTEFAASPFIMCEWNYIRSESPCGVQCLYPSGNLTANFHTGAWDPSFFEPGLPSTGGTDAGAGTWHAILFSR